MRRDQPTCRVTRAAIPRGSDAFCASVRTGSFANGHSTIMLANSLTYGCQELWRGPTKAPSTPEEQRAVGILIGRAINYDIWWFYRPKEQVKRRRLFLWAAMVAFILTTALSGEHRRARFAQRHHHYQRKTASPARSEVRRGDQGEGLGVEGVVATARRAAEGRAEHVRRRN